MKAKFQYFSTNVDATARMSSGQSQVLQEAQALLGELEAVNRVQTQAPAKVIATTTMVVCVITGLLAAHAYWSYLFGNKAVAAPWIPLVCTFILAIVSSFFG